MLAGRGDLRFDDLEALSTSSKAAKRPGAGERAVGEERSHCESDYHSRQDAEPPRRRAVDAASLRAAEVLLVAHAPLAERAGVTRVAAWAGATRRREAAVGGLRRAARTTAMVGGVALVNLGGSLRGAPVIAPDAEGLEGGVGRRARQP